MYSKSGSSFQGPRTSSSCERLKTSLTVSIRGDVSEERIIQLAHGVQRLHEHIRVGDLAREQMVQGLLGALVVAGLDQFVGLAGAGFGRDVRSQIANDVAAFLYVGRRPTAALAVEEVGATAP